MDPDDLRRLDAFIEPQGADTVWWRFTNSVVRDAAYHGAAVPAATPHAPPRR